MDKNTIIGLVLIVLIIVGFSIMNRPTEEQLERQRRYNDSIAWVRKAELEKQEAIRTAKMLAEQQSEAVADSAAARQQLQDVYGVFAGSVMGTDTLYVLENDLLRVRISSKGGRIYSAELKNYRTHDSLPLFLFDGDESQFGFTLVTNNNRVLNTADMYFVPTDGQIVRDNEGNQQLTMRLKTSGEAYMDFVYTLPANDYMLKMDVRSHAMEQVLPLGTNFLEMQWNAKVRQQEKGRKFEERYATLQYKFMDDEIENLSESKDDKKDIPSRLKWIAFKDQFFSSVIIADDAFTSTVVESAMMTEKSGYIKSYKSSMSVEYDPTGNQPTGFRFYLGPNHYKTLLSYDKGVDRDERLRLNELIPLGWKIVAWINRIGVIPMFNLFSRWFSNFGIIILLMTIVIKIVIFPFTYKSYISSAKMRVLKPEIDEINARIPAEKMQERQQATMALYRKVGVSPMSGCLPLLFQFPILMAMFWFFPTSIELRQQSFLWADDLSTYDAIISWDAYIPIITPYFGNHISLFCLLMTVTNIIYSKINMASQPGANEQMQFMKWMMYLMPIMFMFIFNNYAAGLSYYYFVSLLITIIQTYIFRWTIDEKKLLEKLHAKRAKNERNPKKSGFMARLEKMQREQQAYAREQAKKRSR